MSRELERIVRYTSESFCPGWITMLRVRPRGGRSGKISEGKDRRTAGSENQSDRSG
jgi:hypothetical protein